MTTFRVSASVILSGSGFEPNVMGGFGADKTSVWHEGDPVSPRSSRKHVDSGMKIIVLPPTEEVEWVVELQSALSDLCSELHKNRSLMVDVIPHLSIYVETDGESFPPMFFPQAFLKMLGDIGAEIDIDVIAVL